VSNEKQNATSPGSLAEALVAIQSDPPEIPLDATNPHFRSRYASLAGVMEKVLPVASSHGLAIIQLPTVTETGAPALTTKIIHAATGEEQGSTMLLLPGKADPQGQGAALTYARRYMVLSMLGLVGDEDDDGNAASTTTQQQAAPAKVNGGGQQIPEDRVNELGRAIGRVGTPFNRLALLFGSVGADAPQINRSDSIRKALRALSPEQAEKFEAALSAEADRNG
jgi:hypothetical protein